MRAMGSIARLEEGGSVARRHDGKRVMETFNGWANYETWNAALWIGNDEFLYNTAKACVIYREGLETPWDKFVRCMTDGQIGRMLGKTEDGVSWNDPSIDADEMNEMIWDL